ncbi:MAG TPA: cation transporter [Bryobacteraceae bacterium]|nr:cation transporter [Bryobacteraceae bacterium]
MQRALSLRRGQILEWFTLACCLLETSVGLLSGAQHNSVALLSFGAQSFVEVASATVLIWRLGNDHHHSHDVERRALRIEGYCFFAIALYVSADSARALSQREAPTLSVAGIALALFSLVVMPLLAAAKRKVSRSVSSDALEADAKQSALCGYFAGILLLGLILNQGVHVWWADSVASLVMVPLILAEGKRALEGKSCSHCH